MKKYLIANWKMNPPTMKEAEHLASVTARAASDAAKAAKKNKNVEVVVCPSFVHLSSVRSQGSNVALGGQDCFWENPPANKGSYTGEISPQMLKNLGCQYVIVGHSERREHFNEDERIINKKLKAALAAHLRPVLAVGEKARESFDNKGRYTNELDPILKKQIEGALAGVSAVKAKNIIIAYEPVWAVGTGNPALPDDVLSAKILIRQTLARFYSRSLAEKIPVLYGGSTDSKNLLSFLEQGGADGALVGGSSLNGTEFGKMIKIANQ